MSVVYLFYTEQGDLAVMEDEEETEFIPANGQKRDVKTGTRRGQYNRVPTDARKRILDCFRAGGDWKLAATANVDRHLEIQSNAFLGVFGYAFPYWFPKTIHVPETLPLAFQFRTHLLLNMQHYN